MYKSYKFYGSSRNSKTVEQTLNSRGNSITVIEIRIKERLNENKIVVDFHGPNECTRILVNPIEHTS